MTLVGTLFELNQGALARLQQGDLKMAINLLQHALQLLRSPEHIIRGRGRTNRYAIIAAQQFSSSPDGEQSRSSGQENENFQNITVIDSDQGYHPKMNLFLHGTSHLTESFDTSCALAPSMIFNQAWGFSLKNELCHDDEISLREHSTISSIILYNLALSLHYMGLKTCMAKYQAKALELYSWVVTILESFLDDPEDEEHMFLFLSTMNNSRYIHCSFFNIEEARDHHEIMREAISALIPDPSYPSILSSRIIDLPFFSLAVDLSDNNADIAIAPVA